MNKSWVIKDETGGIITDPIGPDEVMLWIKDMEPGHRFLVECVD